MPQIRHRKITVTVELDTDGIDTKGSIADCVVDALIAGMRELHGRTTTRYRNPKILEVRIREV